MKRFVIFLGVLSVICALGVLSPPSALGQQKAAVSPGPRGVMLFRQMCGSCHSGSKGTNGAPSLSELMALSPESIYATLTTGTMAAVVGQKLTDADKRAMAGYLGGRPLTDTGGAEKMPNHCASTPPLENIDKSPSWNGWSPNLQNTRYDPVENGGLTAEQVPQLKLKWAFGFPHGDTVYSQPTVVGGRIFIGGDMGYLYSLDAETGCVYWSYRTKAGVKSAPTVGPVKGLGATKYAVFVGDLRGTVYALDAATGKELWTGRTEKHYGARIAAALVFYDGVVYVPMSSVEEVFSADESYACCTFRGNIAALDASTGRQIWKSYVIPDAPKPVRKNIRGVQLWGPAGAAVWNSPTIDPKLHALYVGTGDAYTEPAAATSDAIVAMDLKTGRILWSFQAVKNDAWAGGCYPKPTDNCPKNLGPDHDFGASPILLNLPNGHRLLLGTPKSGTVFALDPDRQGALLWSLPTTTTVAPNNGQIAFGGASDGKDIYLALEDGTFIAVNLATGKPAWRVRLEDLSELGPPTRTGENRTKENLRFGQSAAVTEIPGAVFTGGWDGILRALSTSDGKVIWQFNTVRDFETVNGVDGKGGSMGGPGVTVVNGTLYVGTGYANMGGGLPGNVLLAFSAASAPAADSK
jgi:polyvinyl alcohol dehydrogenase (cytochrome)